MTVKELIEKLQELDQTADVVFDKGGAFYDVSTVELLDEYVGSSIVLDGNKC